MLELPSAKSQTEPKFRFKRRANKTDFGVSFAARQNNFDRSVYLEWQIGYDVPVSEVENGARTTSITFAHFIGANGKEKYPAELSEFYYEALKCGLIVKDDVKALYKEINDYDSFIDDREISVERPTLINFHGINYHETSIKLPTLFMNETVDDTQIEVSIEKQQYATGVQPMIYFCLPIFSFSNGLEFVGRTSKPGESLKYVIDERNVSNLTILMKIFGMASRRHQHDIAEILKLFLTQN